MFLIFEDFLTDKYCIFLAFVLAKVVQKLDSAIQRLNNRGLEAKSQNWGAGPVILKEKCLDD